MSPKTFTPAVLTEQQERAIHEAACEIVAATVTRQPLQLADPTLGGAAGMNVAGSFVSLKRRGQLRGCCGVFGVPTELSEAISQAARRTPKDDVRFPSVSPTELEHLDLEVWLLQGPQPVPSQGEQRVSDVIIGRHGLQIRRGNSRGLLLPGVAVDHNLDAEGFLELVCEKAKLPPTAWKEADTELLTFEGHEIKGPFLRGIADAAVATQSTFLTNVEVAQLVEHARRNLFALLRSTLGCCSTVDCPDGTAHGLSLALYVPGWPRVPRFSKLSLRPGLPLQPTLYQLTELAARSLSSQGIGAQALAGLKLDLTVLWDPAMHGPVADPDLKGFDPATRALLTMEGGRSAWVYDAQQSAERLLETASRAAEVRTPSAAVVMSLATVSTESSVMVPFVSRPQRGPQVRPPAVAGSFYPSGAQELADVVKGLLNGSGQQRAPWPAVLVPHAGLKYSGHIAARVFERVDIPEVVIVVGPRHRLSGMEWAVAPHETWSLPGLAVASDPELASQLANAIPDLHLDAAAHQQEHSIEVQLPLLARLAPHARVVGIAIGAGDLDRCRQFAEGLATVLRGWQSKPLLVISSDLNHYASDDENRRLDAIALSALDQLDPAHLYETTAKHKISMCGKLPAVIVLETLRQMGKLTACEHVAYATSADVTGDKSRVVGYAGMLFG